MKKIVILASGNGTNAQAIIDHFASSKLVTVSLILSNKPQAYVLERGTKAGISVMSFNRFAFAKAEHVQRLLNQEQPDLIVLAGFLWKIPSFLIQDHPNKIINIHPALLPNYGGKGMYGMNVHRAIIENKETESGISIHYVTENYDEGAIIKQATCSIAKTDTAEDLAAKIHLLEQEYFATTIEELLS
ncbi:phosphoribosylglycinamide formyltransferase [Nonlabens sp. Ci31]|jgi:phosphoribosylglycinamide formyltransferase-1|uniref:phosphoribosylglycinamide formyltransferase n=1 Tax=Nonlabens sp. Ci31 TaxID=2608253 RepID=UPI0014629363|nr:phosphoribosylglycinamide formyltransferase [Nonlabens sp. Ci31]QJP33904.1 phosphoribosylglycinamide formyltransferase [Nonlabens sp. Ci31]